MNTSTIASHWALQSFIYTMNWTTADLASIITCWDPDLGFFLINKMVNILCSPTLPEASSALVDSGNAVLTTWSMTLRRYWQDPKVQRSGIHNHLYQTIFWNSGCMVLKGFGYIKRILKFLVVVWWWFSFSEATTVIRSCSHSSPGCQEWEPGPKGLGSDAPPNTWKNNWCASDALFPRKGVEQDLWGCVFLHLCCLRGKYTRLRHLHQRCVAHGLACSRKRPLRLVTSTNCWAARHMKSKSPSDPWKGKVAKNTFRNPEKNCRLIQALDGF